MLESPHLLESMALSSGKQLGLVGAVGIELFGALKTRKLLVPHAA